MSAFRYHYALVCRIPTTFAEKCRSLEETKEEISIDLARKQHEEYVESLRRLGIDVLELPNDERHPDCAFVDDCAVIINGTALICKPEGSRLGEVAMVRNTLRKELGLKIVEIDNENATVEGGDVLWTGKEIIVGISKYTNKLGAIAVAKAFPEYNTAMVELPRNSLLHLKNMISVAGVDILAIGKSREARELLQRIQTQAYYTYRTVTVEEDKAANVIFANGVVIHLADSMIPKSYPIFENKMDIRESADISEIYKGTGGLTSLSLLVTKIKHPKHFVTTVQDEELQKHCHLDYLDSSSPGGTLNRSTINRNTLGKR